MAHTIRLTGSRGTVHTLACTEDDYQLAVNPGLWGKAPVSFGSRALANIDGERITSVRRLPRLIPVPLLIVADTQLELDERLAALGSILDVTENLTLRISRDDGSTREITCRYVSGAEAIQLQNGDAPHVARIPAVFKAFDPDWRLPNEDALVIANDFDDARLSQITSLQIDNPGDLDVFPEWVINGPVENIHLVNLNLGLLMRVTEVLDTSDVLRIRTDPRSPGVWINDQINWRAIEGGTSRWPLVPGRNLVEIRGAGLPSGAIGDYRMTAVPRFDTC